MPQVPVNNNLRTNQIVIAFFALLFSSCNAPTVQQASFALSIDTSRTVIIQDSSRISIEKTTKAIIAMIHPLVYTTDVNFGLNSPMLILFTGTNYTGASDT